MQTVDVLGDDGLQLPLLLPLSELFVSGVGLSVQGQHFTAVKVVEFLGVGLKKCVTEHGFRRIFELLVIQTVHAAKVLDAGLRADPGSAEEDDIVALIHQLFQLQNGFVHRKILRFNVVKGYDREYSDFWL